MIENSFINFVKTEDIMFNKGTLEIGSGSCIYEKGHKKTEPRPHSNSGPKLYHGVSAMWAIDPSHDPLLSLPYVRPWIGCIAATTWETHRIEKLSPFNSACGLMHTLVTCMLSVPPSNSSSCKAQVLSGHNLVAHLWLYIRQWETNEWQVTIAHVAETKECMSRVQARSHIIFSCCHTFTSHTSLRTLTDKLQIGLPRHLQYC